MASTSGRTNTPTLINLPPPPADPVTPSDVPGTPTSTTTSMSELSTVAIKDGHRGHLHHHHRDIHAPSSQASNSPSHMDAERADRISRLAGLDRLAAGNTSNRGATTGANVASSSISAMSTTPSVLPTHAYFDAQNIPQIVRERSTVGSASATTGSVGGEDASRTERTGTSAWGQSELGENGSDVGMGDADAGGASDEDMEVEANSSVGGFSDEGYAGSVGGPPHGEVPRSGRSYPAVAAAGLPSPTRLHQQTLRSGAPHGVGHDAKMGDGVTFDKDVLGTGDRTPAAAED